MILTCSSSLLMARLTLAISLFGSAAAIAGPDPQGSWDWIDVEERSVATSCVSKPPSAGLDKAVLPEFCACFAKKTMGFSMLAQMAGIPEGEVEALRSTAVDECSRDVERAATD